MADTKLTALSASAALDLDNLLYVVDDPSGTPASVKATVTQLLAIAGLLHTAGTDADTSMAVGRMYVTDMSAWATADRTYTLPATAAVGDRVGIMVSAGDASHELIITANTGDTLNGIAGGTEWSRLFITGEVVIMRCVAANATWIVENDGRIPCKVAVSGSYTHTSSGSYQTIDLSAASTIVDDGATLVIASDQVSVIRRPGLYIFAAYTETNLSTNGKALGIQMRVAASAIQPGAAVLNSSGGAFRIFANLRGYRVSAVGDVYDAQLWQNDSASEAMNYYVSVEEVLRYTQ